MRNPQPPRRAVGPATTLDHVDHQLLRALSENADVTNKALAGRLGLAESTCAYRVRALREAGVITGTRAQLDLALLGCPLQAIIMVRLGSHTMANVNQLYDALAATPGVLQAFHVAGADDFYLHVAVENAEALRDFVLQYVTTHRVVRQTETHLVFEVRNGAGVLRSRT
ncbi:Lrp/AsnC family transcriptional regulator [Actinoplanes sp. NEAU-A12]|uniref:Lrp/AsnC family transcriptional regulator n=1 Tax=Actinoplanes sandaracinus TaxID=3045177 RepID=A0ABT6WGA4_9ACTN|nr:Lrp/AsnC family transcriptional regulator [Actinoplanes sandaracinus]MDI6098756.1 Lrp/AsnC family transcriptional regulator [Actinoplanes sandaracinus]